MNKKYSLLLGLCPLILVACTDSVRTSVRYVGTKTYAPRPEDCDVRITGVSPEHAEEIALLNGLKLSSILYDDDAILTELKRKTCLVGGDTLYLKTIASEGRGDVIGEVQMRVFATALLSGSSRESKAPLK